MKAFTFSLERMRDYKSQVLETEKNLLLSLHRKLAEIEEKIRLTREFRREKQEEIRLKQQQGSTMRELEECRFYLEHTRRQLESLEEERIRAALEVERQRKTVLKASQDVSSLDKLEEKQKEDYHFLEARDNEKVIQEHVIHQLIYSVSGPQATTGIVS